jgi:hypothetical protein
MAWIRGTSSVAGVIINNMGYAVPQLVEPLRYKSRALLPMVSSEFFIISSFRPPCGPGVDSASNRNEFVCFPGVTTHCGCIFTAR